MTRPVPRSFGMLDGTERPLGGACTTLCPRELCKDDGKADVTTATLATTELETRNFAWDQCHCCTVCADRNAAS